MSRMTILDGNLWLSLSAGREPRGSAKVGAGYPPYNIELLADDETLRITLAVAGFNSEELEVSVEDRALIVSGRQHDDESKDYLHRGIAARQFKRSFTLATALKCARPSLTTDCSPSS